MAEKKVVSIEDRIPKLKQNRKKKSNRRLIAYLSVLFLLIATIVYLQSPLSHVQKIVVQGNQHMSSEEIKALSKITLDMNYWEVDTKEVALQLENHKEISEAKVSRHFPRTIEVEVDEVSRIGYIKTNGQFQPILEDGTRLEETTTVPSGDAPILAGFSKPTYLKEMAKELKQLPESVTSLISEVQWDPQENNPYQIRLYMNDGFQVQASIRNFSSKMPAYPSIASQLKEGAKGIIHIDVGAYFERYAQSESKEGSSNEDER